MTTIVWRDGLVAADSRIIRGGDRISPETVMKVWRLEHGGLGAAAGAVWIVSEFRDWLNRGQKAWERPKVPDDTVVMEFKTDGHIVEYATDGVTETNPARGYFAWGSGADYAYGAMEMGASARRAVEIAMLFDYGTGGDITVLEVCQRADDDGA